MRTRVVIQSRLSSSRLSGKALLTVAGMPLVELVARRASRSGFEVVVATSTEPYDQLIADALQSTGIPAVLGPLDDVLDRFAIATSDLDADDMVVRLTGDNPVVDAELVQEVIDAVAAAGRDYGRVDIEQVPEGLGVEVFPARLLREAADRATASYDREHVTPWIRRNTDELLFAPVANPGLPELYRCTVDCLHDYARAVGLFAGEQDPVGVSWSRLVEKLGEGIPDFAVTLAQAGRRFALDTRGVTQGATGERLRELFARASDVGVGDVLVDSDSIAAAATGAHPALRGRFAFHYATTAGDLSPESLDAELWRAAAALGVPRWDGVVGKPSEDRPSVAVRPRERPLPEPVAAGSVDELDAKLTALANGA